MSMFVQFSVSMYVKIKYFKIDDNIMPFLFFYSTRM